MRRHRRGGSAIEFALGLPVVITLLTGILDWGAYLSAMHEVQSAAREATRMGASTDQDDDPISSAELRASERLAEVGLSGSGSASLSGDAPDQTITVDVVGNYTPWVGLVPTPSQLHGAMTMRMEDQP